MDREYMTQAQQGRVLAGTLARLMQCLPGEAKLITGFDFNRSAPDGIDFIYNGRQYQLLHIGLCQVRDSVDSSILRSDDVSEEIIRRFYPPGLPTMPGLQG